MSGGLSTRLSSVCPFLQRLLPQPLLVPFSDISAPSLLHPSESVVGLGHPVPIHPPTLTLVLNHLHGPGRSILKSQIQLVGQPCCLARIYLL